MSSRFPNSFDGDDNLHLVHDYMRVRLAEDYNPNDTFITVEGDEEIINKFPSTGIITLTEQCSDIESRAISLSYTSRSGSVFSGLSLLSGFPSVSKPKRLTNVTQNVIAEHHNQIKDAIIAIENFVGIKGVVASVPLTGTMEARINFLRKLVLKPRAWFSATRRVGIHPLCITFDDFSTRSPDYWIWDFGDGTISTISRSGLISSGTVSKCYFTPDVYDVKLTVGNDFGTNEITFENYINVRNESPDEATIEFIPSTEQIFSDDVLRSRVSKDIQLKVTANGAQPGDSIVRYIWDLSDDLTHGSSIFATASYGVGGLYDVKLKTESNFGSYRITVLENSIDIVERTNIWHLIFSTSFAEADVTKNLYAYEFGTISEVYKAAATSSSLSVTRDYSFLEDKDDYERQYREFRDNNAFAARTTVSSGDAGASLLFWSDGSETDVGPQNVQVRQFNGFNQVWTTPATSSFSRFWNWASFAASDGVYFTLGIDDYTDNEVTNQTFNLYSNLTLTASSYTFTDYKNGADELMTNVGDGFSVYRTCWKEDEGYLVRNDGSGSFFRLKSFYRVSGIDGNSVYTISKLNNVPGNPLFEGKMVALSGGIYLFNNTGDFLIYNTTSNTWTSGGPSNVTSFSSLQDTTVSGFDDVDNTLVAVSDGDRLAYLFYDYSTRAQMKFNEADFTFITLPVRPSGEQMTAGIY